jgi:O-antigen ligase
MLKLNSYNGSWLLIIYFFLFPLDPIFKFYGMGAISSHIILGLLIAILLFTLKINSKFYLPKASSLYLSLVVFFIFSLIWNLNIQNGYFAIYVFVLNLTIVFVVYNFYIKIYSLNFKYIIYSYCLSCTLLGILSIKYFFTFGSMFGGGRVTIADYNPSWLAAFYAIGIILLLFHREKATLKLEKILKAILVIVLLIFLILSQGRNSILALVVLFFVHLGIALYPVIIKIIIENKLNSTVFNKIFKIAIVSTFVLTAVSVFIFLVLDIDISLFKRFSLLFSGDSARATAGRTTIWSNYIKLSTNPIFGSGVGSATSLYNSVFGASTPPHNIFILLFIETGLIGLFLFLLFSIKLIKNSFNNSKTQELLLSLSIFALLISFGNDTLVYRYYWIALMFYFIYSVTKPYAKA